LGIALPVCLSPIQYYQLLFFPMSNPTIATLITCYNRKQKTLDCLAALVGQSTRSTVTLSIYLVDDGSTDGTAVAVAAAYPQVTILAGDGNLYWNGGMRLAFAKALERDYDYYLWLNDDTLLNPNALEVLLQTADPIAGRGDERGAIVVGSTCDPDTGTLTYGGMLQQNWWRPMHLARLQPSDAPQKCDTVNGNCVLISRSVVRVVGNLDPAFTHYMGDLDYGLRAHKQGCTIWVAPGYLGTCAENTRPNNWREVLGERPWYHQWQQICSPKGLDFTTVTLSPLAEWKAFSQRHAGLLWPIYWLSPYRRLLLAPIANLLQRFPKSYSQ
jgi:GT2 family glycosyltransferase